MGKAMMRYSLVAVGLALSACTAPPLDADTSDRLTVGVVQREITMGMSGAEVASVLGSPNVVTSDGEGRETWVYDKISTERAASRGGAYGTLILFGGSTSSSRASTSQKTLTVVIKFDEKKNVRDFAYRQSSF